jgi:hypothetical protein
LMALGVQLPEVLKSDASRLLPHIVILILTWRINYVKFEKSPVLGRVRHYAGSRLDHGDVSEDHQSDN